MNIDVKFVETEPIKVDFGEVHLINIGGSQGSVGKKMYSFGVLSDIHLGYESRNATTDFQRANRVLHNLGVEFVCITGDIGYYSDTSSVESELQSYQTEIVKYPETPYYACTGNHDIKHTDTLWERYTGYPKNFTIVKDGDVFLFMSLTQSVKASSVANPYTTNLTEWLQGELNRYQGARIFLFMHYPITGYAGLTVHQSYGFTSDSTEDAVLLKLLTNTDNVTVFNGHTHYKFECENEYPEISVYPDINVTKFANKNVAIAHVPSCAYPRNLNSSNYEEEWLSQGYIVEVYEHGIKLRGVDFVAENYMTEYEYTIMVENNPVVANTPAIVLTPIDVSLSSGESAEIEISLTEPANAIVNLTESNDYITVSPTSLTFTEDNYSIPQKITITAGTLEASESTMVTVSAEGLTSRTISVSLTHEEPEEPEVAVTEISGSMTPVNGTVYGGVCGSSTAVNQLKSSAAETYDFTFRNLTLASSDTGVYMSSSGSITTINLKGTNTIDTSGSSKKTQRAISSSGTSGNYLIGVNESAELILKGRTDATTELIKGNWIIENAKVTATGTTVSGYVLVETVTPATNGEPAGITLRKNGMFSLNGSAVELIACDNGYLEVNLGSATAGISALTITPYANDGYTLSAIMVNGVEQSADTALTMPATNETLTIQAVFKN